MWGSALLLWACLLVTGCPATRGEGTSGGSQDLPIRTPCQTDRSEIVFPTISTKTSTSASSHDGLKVGDPLPDTVLATLTWKGRQLPVTLFRSDVSSGGLVMTYEDRLHNVTMAETGRETCHFQGFVEDEQLSFAALSTCDGLAGYIQTDEEILFIESLPARREGGHLWEQRPHLVYTCQNHQTPQSTNATDTGEPIPLVADPKPRRRRRRRSTGRKRHLEVQMVVDHTVVAMHGKERVKNYALTLMNIANSVYQHHTLGVNLRVVVTEIILLEEEDQQYVLIKRDAYRTVQQFCQWSMYRQQSTPGPRHDMAVLLTREKLGPAGYAPITGLCNPSRSCAAITDEGFTSGFIIAHEMAHVFGLFHDGHGNRCSGRRYTTAIMAPLVEAKLNHFWWSECSKERMQQVINYLYCLNDDPEMLTEVEHYEVDSGPRLSDDLGQHWSLDFQCRLEFGDEFGLCASFPSDHCSMLWCSMRATPHLCRTKRGPAAPGTDCGHDRQCRGARCTYVGREQPVHGGWSSWAAWDDCSVSCGVGIKRRQRQCTNPSPAYGGRQCEGETDSWDTCVAENCEQYDDPREGHCAVWNDMNIRHGYHDWKPYPATRKSDQCKQTCVSSHTREVVTINVEVSDGTPCDYDQPTNICLLGECLMVGCDGVRNSTKQYDACGICGGDNSQCKTVSGLIRRAPASGDQYESIIFLPKGARNVEVVKRGTSKHILALKETAYGIYRLNGDKKLERSRVFVLGGARFQYTNNNRGHQTIVTRGPLHAHLEIMVYPDNDTSRMSVTYEYSINKNDYTLEKRKYKWRFKDWSGCSVTCGEGVTSIRHACHDMDTGDRVEDDRCQYLDPPRKDQAPCTMEPCSLRRYIWAMTNDWSECSAERCGEEGVQTQGYKCELYFMNNGTYEDADMDKCDPDTAPTDARNCTAPPCPDLYTWVMTNDWSECSAERCGEEGVQTQGYKCQLYFMNNDTYKDADMDQCDPDTAPTDARNCTAPPCPELYTWVMTNDWSECSAKRCGEEGVQAQGYKCQLYFMNNDTYKDADMDQCDPDTAPTDARNCTAPPCPELYTWVMTNDWSECSAERCGEEGVQTQGYKCQLYFMNNDTYKDANMDQCDPDTAPTDARSCTAPPCPVLSWTMLEWSQCSVTCGKGRQRRRVYCGDPDTDSDDIFCRDMPPPLSRVCQQPPCKDAPLGDEECVDRYSFCAFANSLSYKCLSKRFADICCKSCKRQRSAARSPRLSSWAKYRMRMRNRRN